jgi:hypothetical protein
MPFLTYFTAETGTPREEINLLQEQCTYFAQVIFKLWYEKEELSYQNLTLHFDNHETSEKNSSLMNVVVNQYSHIQELLYENQNLRNVLNDTESSKLTIATKNTILEDDNTILQDENDSLHQQNGVLCTILSIAIAVLGFFLVYLDSLSLESAQSLPCI